MARIFNASYQGIGDMLRSEFMRVEMERRANRIRDAAVAEAPVGTPPDDTHPGRYKASFRVESGTRGGWKHDRAYAEVVNDAPEAFYIEYGSSKITARHVLAHAMDAAKDA